MKTFLPTLLLLAICWPTFVTAQQQPITLKDVPVGLPVISADEPMAAGFSAEKAAAVSGSFRAELGEDQEVRHLPYQPVLHGCATGAANDPAGLG